MKILFSTPCKPIPVFLDRFLSIDDVSFRFVFDQGLFSASADVPYFNLHFLAQNLNASSVVLEWPTFEELEAELKSDHYDYVGIGFKCLDLYTVAEMLDRIRNVSPDTKIVLGGYGTLALDEPEAEYIKDRADYICRNSEGVRFMRTIMGDSEPRPMICHLPIEVVRIPWLPGVNTKIGYILSALGCEWKCEFCCTSAFAEGRVIEVMTPEEIHESIRWYYGNYPDLGQIYMMDEELLLRQPKVRALGKLLREDQDFGLSKVSYLAFSTLKSLAAWEPEDLLLNGIGQVWTGIESMYSYSNKKGAVDSKALIQTLHEHGIETQLSWIIGDDCQTPENIGADIDYVLSHEPCTVQLAVLSASPGTALYKRLKAEGRIRPFAPEESHLLGNNMDALHFTHEQRVEAVTQTHKKLYDTYGPSVMRATGVFMNGYEHCSRSQNPYLKDDRREYFRKKIQNSISLIKVAIAFAPTPEVKQAMIDLQHRYVDLFGPFRKTQQITADYFLKLADQEMARRENQGHSTLREIPLKRYTYDNE